MTLTRRKFLSISVAFVALPNVAQAQRWTGRAFGADVSLELFGPHETTGPAIEHIQRLLGEVERLFNLYDPQSTLSKLNATGHFLDPDPRFVALMERADHAYRLSGGLFDPSVQSLWSALAEGRLEKVHNGWEAVRFDKRQITLAPGQSLTFNGIAQGFATDLLSDALSAIGLKKMQVNIGEHRATTGDFTRGLTDPTYGQLATRQFATGAIATSSAKATQVQGAPHIMHPVAQPRWSTVSVEAQSATLADSLSTAMVLATRNQIEDIAQRADLKRITLIDFEGNLTSI